MTQATLTPHATPAAAPNLAAIKSRQQAVWTSGDYGRLGVTLQIVGESLCEAVDLHAGEQVLDVAAGNGNASLAAARRFAEVTSTDYVTRLLDQGRERAAVERLPIEFKFADAEQLPFNDSCFDVVLSSFGVMFTPDQERAASELLRVTRAGGRIGLANWTPDGFIGSVFKIVGKHVPPPAGAKPPGLWGTEPRLVELFGPASSDIRVVRKQFMFRYLSAAHWIQVFETYYGPILKALESLDANGQAAMRGDLTDLLERSNRAGPGTLIVPGDYLEVVITKA